MIDFVLLVIVVLFLNQGFLNLMNRRHSFLNKKLLWTLFFYHFLFFIVYYVYALYNPSDSKQYYFVSSEYGSFWLQYFETGTNFIHFIAIPFVQLGLSYISTMFLFSWFGYIGFVYAYLFFKENIPVNVRVFGGFDFLTLLLFLPNMHFWTASLGKGCIIFLGLMIISYSIRSPFKRLIPFLVGGFLVYMIRPHVMFFVLMGMMLALWRTRERINFGIKFFAIGAAFVFLLFAADSILAVANLENSEDLYGDFMEFSEESSASLSQSAGSGVDMSSYPIPIKFLTFWFRPLFFDAPNALGLIISFENLLYIFIFLKVFSFTFFKYFLRAPYIVKMAGITFIFSTFALTFVMSNLGIIMRQKSMVMYFAFFVIYYYLAERQYYKNLYLIEQDKIAQSNKSKQNG